HSRSLSPFVYYRAAPRGLHSFPTRRSSDLPRQATGGVVGMTPFAGAALVASERLGGCRARVPATACRLSGGARVPPRAVEPGCADRKSTRLNSSHVKISYGVVCFKKNKEDD